MAKMNYSKLSAQDSLRRESSNSYAAKAHRWALEKAARKKKWEEEKKKRLQR